MCGSWPSGHRVDFSGQFRRGLAGVRAMVETGAEHGVNTETCLHGSGISLAADSVTLDQEFQVARNLEEAVGPMPGLGIAVGRRVGLRAYGVWGFALLTSSTLRQASDIGMRYLPLTYVLTGLRREVTPHSAALVIEDASPFLVEREIATITGIIRGLLGTSPAMRVELRMPFDARYEAFGVPVVCSAARNALVTSVDVLEQPLPQAEPVTMTACEQACRALVSQRAPAGLAGSVRSLVASGVFDADDIAARLHLSARTLRRRLAAEQTSVRRLVDEARRTAAFALLTRGMTVEQAGLRLGYTDAATFIRAFRRWTGMTPHSWRCASESR